MTLEEAKKAFLGRSCLIDWSWGNDRKGATVPMSTPVIVEEIYENSHGEILFISNWNKTPMRVERLVLCG